MQIRRSVVVPILLTFLSGPSFSLAQAANGAIVPFSTLPACAAGCGHLYDAQGACSPPALTAINLQCFCTDGRVSGLATGQDVCVNHPCNAADIATIAAWFQGVCNGVKATTGVTTTVAGGSTQTGAANNGGSSNGGESTPSGPWISTHWNWVVMLVVLILGIAGLWVAAWLLRRRYKRKREINYEMRPPGAPWVQGQPPPMSSFGSDAPVMGNGKNKMLAGLAVPEKAKKKWVVKERT